MSSSLLFISELEVNKRNNKHSVQTGISKFYVSKPSMFISLVYSLDCSFYNHTIVNLQLLFWQQALTKDAKNRIVRGLKVT